jgi:hypothetical protein
VLWFNLVKIVFFRKRIAGKENFAQTRFFAGRKEFLAFHFFCVKNANFCLLGRIQFSLYNVTRGPKKGYLIERILFNRETV